MSFMKDGGAKRRRGADGGNGGNGGDVWIEASRHVKGLGDLPFRIAAGNGGRGAAQGTQGKRGDEINIKVPVGTVVWKEVVDEVERLLRVADGLLGLEIIARLDRMLGTRPTDCSRLVHPIDSVVPLVRTAESEYKVMLPRN